MFICQTAVKGYDYAPNMRRQQKVTWSELRQKSIEFPKMYLKCFYYLSDPRPTVIWSCIHMRTECTAKSITFAQGFRALPECLHASLNCFHLAFHRPLAESPEACIPLYGKCNMQPHWTLQRTALYLPAVYQKKLLSSEYY